MVKRFLKLLGIEEEDRAPAGPHPRDISAQDLAVMRGVTEYPDLLDEVVRSGRDNLGFFPAHNNRAIEYPWVLAQAKKIHPDARILDIGSGLNPLPFALAKDGFRVTTVDAHPTIRTLANRAHWNEWGFLDYSIIDRRITSFNTAYEAFAPDHQFDCIYSVSVIEHLPAETRRVWAKRFAKQLNPGGTLLLTLDLVPDSDDLWNLSEDIQVEDPKLHGSSHDLAKELEREGLVVDSNRSYRQIRGSRIDTGLLLAHKPPAHG